MAGNGLVRCPLCREVEHRDELHQHVGRHSAWELFLFDWDHGSTLKRVATVGELLCTLLLLAIAIGFLRDLTGIG